MSENEVVEFLLVGNTTSDNHYMNFLDLLKAICILVSDNHDSEMIR